MAEITVDAHCHQLKRKDHPTENADDQLFDRVPKRLKNYFEIMKEEKEMEDGISEVDFSSLSKGTEIIKTWHVRKARNLLLEILQAKIGSIPSQIKTVLDDMVNRREEIETLSLYLAEKMVIKCQVHSSEFIHGLLENNRKICPENEISQAEIMFGMTDDSCVEKLHDWEKFTLPNLVRVQQELNLVMMDVGEINQNLDAKFQLTKLKEYEEITHDDDFAYHLDENQIPLQFECTEEERIERLNSLDETDIKEVSEKDQSQAIFWEKPVFIHYDKETNEHIYTEKELTEYDGFINDETLYCKYLYEEMLPDESEMSYTESPFFELKFSLEPKYHNPFLFILETTMQMFSKDQAPQEHQTQEVSYLRLATSLYILNCINTELVYLKNRVTMESYQLMARATVRGVIDSFIDNRDFCCFKMDPDVYTYNVVKPEESDIVKDLEMDLKYFLNGDDVEENDENDDGSVSSESSNESETLPPSEVLETSPPIESTVGMDNLSGYSTDTDSETECDTYLVGHPVWDNPCNVSQSTIQEVNSNKRRVVDPVPKSLTSSYNYLQTDYISVSLDGAQHIQEPIVNEDLLTLYYTDNGKFVRDDEKSVILCADHILDASFDAEHQLPTSESIYRDLTRLMRRGSVLSADSGAYFESFLSLKEYVQGVIEYIYLTKTDKTVTEEDVLDALKYVHQHSHHTCTKRSYDYETSQNYSDLTIHKDFVTDPTLPPESLDDIHFENIHPITNGGTEKDIEVDERFENNDPLTDGPNLSHNICYFLGDMSEIPGSNIFCDTFIEFEDGKKLGLFSPLVKVKCPTFYEQFLRDLPTLSAGLNVQVIKTVLPDVDFDILHEFFEYVYRGGVFSDGENLMSPYILHMEAMYAIHEGAILKDCTVDFNDMFNSCITFHLLWKEENSKDFALSIMKDGIEVCVKFHKFMLASRSESFRTMLIDNPNLEILNVSDIVTDIFVLERFAFYLYHNNITNPQPIEDDSEEEDIDYDKELEENSEGGEKVTEELCEDKTDDMEVDHDESDCESEEEIEITLDQHVQLFKLGQKFKENGLVQLVSRNISHGIDFSNVSDFLTFSIDYQSYDLFKACEFILLSSDKEFIEQVTELEDEREYFNLLRGPINDTNVVEKLSYVMKILNAPSSDLDFYFIHRLDELHKRNLIWFLVRNISNLDEKVLQSLQYIPIDDRINCAQTIKSLASKYYSSLDSFNIPTLGE